MWARDPVQEHELLLGLRLERFEPVDPLDDPLGELHAAVVAGIALVISAPSSSAIRRNSRQVGGEIAVVVGGDAERAQVAVLVEQLARLAELVEPEPAPQRPLELGAPRGQQLVLEGLVGGVERETAGEPVDDLEQRVEPGLDRALAQQRRPAKLWIVSMWQRYRSRAAASTCSRWAPSLAGRARRARRAPGWRARPPPSR